MGINSTDKLIASTAVIWQQLQVQWTWGTINRSRTYWMVYSSVKRFLKSFLSSLSFLRPVHTIQGKICSILHISFNFYCELTVLETILGWKQKWKRSKTSPCVRGLIKQSPCNSPMVNECNIYVYLPPMSKHLSFLSKIAINISFIHYCHTNFYAFISVFILQAAMLWLVKQSKTYTRSMIAINCNLRITTQNF